MDNDDIISALNMLADIRAHIDAINLRYDEERRTILTPVQKMLDQIESARAEETGELREQADDIEAAIRIEVAARGESVKGKSMSAVYVKGRTTWDSKRLSGYAAAHPEIEQFKNIGEPSVSIKSNR